MLVLVIVVLAGCGGGSKSNGEAKKTPEQVVTDARQAALAAKGVHVSGSITDQGVPLTLDITIVRSKGGKGAMSERGLRFQLIRLGDKVYIKGSDAFYKQFAGAAAAFLHGKWLVGSATSGDLAALAPLTDVGRFFRSVLSRHGKLKNDGEVTRRGEKVVAIEDTTQGGTLYVAATGTPYPVEIESAGGGKQGSVTFDHWDETVAIVAPKGAIDITKLKG
jgi:hypothetical protein